MMGEKIMETNHPVYSFSLWMSVNVDLINTSWNPSPLHSKYMNHTSVSLLFSLSLMFFFVLLFPVLPWSPPPPNKSEVSSHHQRPASAARAPCDRTIRTAKFVTCQVRCPHGYSGTLRLSANLDDWVSHLVVLFRSFVYPQYQSSNMSSQSDFEIWRGKNIILLFTGSSFCWQAPHSCSRMLRIVF